MIYLKEGNLLDADVDIVAHQVNCMGVMGSGIAKQIRTLYPDTYRKYRDLCLLRGPSLLGHNLYTEERHNGNRIIVANLFGQNQYGWGNQQTDYDALAKCFSLLAAASRNLYSRNLPNKIGLPWHIGCGRGGGDWSIVYPLIEKHLKEQEVYIFKL